MAVEIVGDNPESIAKYREYLHKQGTYTKRFQKDIEAGTMLPKPDEYRTATLRIKRVKAAHEGEDSTADAPEDRIIIQGVANENAVDRMDERLEPAGVDIENFKKNPVLLIDHLYMTRAVVGTVTSVVPEDDGVKFTAELAKKTDEGLTDAQRETRILVKQGLVGTVSVGFIPIKIRAPEYDNEGRLLEPPVILQWELLEISIVAVPANAGSTFEMKNLIKKIAMLEHSLDESGKSEGKRLTLTERFDKIKSQIKQSKDLTEGEMDKLEELLAEVLGLLKAQAEKADANSKLLEEIYARGASSDEEEKEEEEKEGMHEDEDEDKKALADIQQAIKSNSESIAKIAEVVTELVNRQ